MNCEVVQRRLMSIEDPARVPPDVRAHLAACGTCRDWQGQLVQVERHVPLLPVPRSRGKSRFLRKLLQRAVPQPEMACLPAIVPAATGKPTFAPWPGQPSTHRLRKLRVFGGLAAAVVLLLLGWLLVRAPESAERDRPASKAAADPLLASLVQYDLRLTAASSPGERLTILADVAQALHDESRTLAGESARAELAELAGLYERVIRGGISKYASALPAAQRARSLKPIIDQLEKAAQASERLSRRTPAECARPVQQMAAVAWEGRRQLTTLLAEVRG